MSLFQKNLSLPSKDTTIWRYMNLEKFLSLIIEKKLFFCRLDKLTDMYEGTVPEGNKKDIIQQLKKVPFITNSEIYEKSKQRVETIHEHKKFTLVNCWSMYEEESFALWKIYTKPKYGIAIKSKLGKLQECLAINKDLDFRVVEYNNDKAKSETQSSIPVTKKTYYKFENEIRVLLYNQYDSNGSSNILNFSPLYTTGKGMDVNINILFDNIYLSPTAPVWFENIARILISEILNDNFKNKVLRSNIKDDI